ncbi:hypothetical protein BJ508DRAFT_332717 [Ascobolus immersus RN42]|uniref:Uncharacterized protein n=1 Tax=Ascobolus immersus RN42 TaxID=1160509 RepID=A0A3N4HYL9_ASCIM|nr:hypothetical protein BJ508DRAFT_332717 [Ascobolus immersus RN42]
MGKRNRKQEQAFHMNEIRRLKKQQKVVHFQTTEPETATFDPLESDHSITSQQEALHLDHEVPSLAVQLPDTLDLDHVLQLDNASASEASDTEYSSDEDSGVDEADLDLFDMDFEDLEIEDLDFKRAVPKPFWEESVSIKGRNAPGTSASSQYRQTQKRAEGQKIRDTEAVKKVTSFFPKLSSSSGCSTASTDSRVPTTFIAFARSSLQREPSPHIVSVPSQIELQLALPEEKNTELDPAQKFHAQAKVIAGLLKSKKLEKTGGEAWKGQNRKRHEVVMRMLLYQATTYGKITRTAALLAVANNYGKGPYLARQIRRWERA